MVFAIHAPMTLSHENPETIDANPKLSILLVDDNELILKALARQLRDQTIDKASDIQSAVEILRARQVDMVVTDYSMPSGDGVALLELVRRVFPRVTRVLMSSAPPAALNELIAGGVVQHFMAKPLRHHPLSEHLVSVNSQVPQRGMRPVTVELGAAQQATHGPN